MDAGLSPLEAELLAALKVAREYAKGAKADLLCKAGGLSDKAFDLVQTQPYWIRVMSDCAQIDAAISKALGGSHG
jgi:hypothetical protein